MTKSVKKEEVIGTTAVNSLVSSTKIEPSEEEKKKESDVMALLSRLSPEKPTALVKPRRDSANTDGVPPTPKVLPPPKPFQRDGMRDENGEKKLNPMDMTLEQRQEASRKQALSMSITFFTLSSYRSYSK